MSTPDVQQEGWPEIDAEAFHGVAGRIVTAIAPLTEADEVAILGHLLITFGNALGRGPYYLVGNTRHHLNLFGVFCGDTAVARKGTAYDPVEYIMRLADPEWAKNCIRAGLISGEGIIHSVRDEIVGIEKVPGRRGQPASYAEVVKDHGVEDKRLFVMEQEFAGALAAMSRPGNTLSPVLRLAWDGRKLQTLGKNNPEEATEPHISIAGHITVEELRIRLDSTEMASGFANRFLWLLARRSKELPFAKPLPLATADSFPVELHDILSNQVIRQEIAFHPEAARIWEAEYHDLTADHGGLFGAVVARAAPQVLRLGTLYAVLDQYRQIHPQHLRAALALWRYCEGSAKHIFGDMLGNSVADTILRALRDAESGMTRTAIRDLFSHHQPAGHIDRALHLLQRYRRARMVEKPTGGKPVTIWYAA